MGIVRASHDSCNNALVDDVVAVEDGAALVAGQEHGDPLGHAGADQVATRQRERQMEFEA